MTLMSKSFVQKRTIYCLTKKIWMLLLHFWHKYIIDGCRSVVLYENLYAHSSVQKRDRYTFIWLLSIFGNLYLLSKNSTTPGNVNKHQSNSLNLVTFFSYNFSSIFFIDWINVLKFNRSVHSSQIHMVSFQIISFPQRKG